MAADNELPVWTIRPNWRGSILERLEWLTDVLDGTDGNEQRRALRLSPRRSFEATFNPTGDARSYFDLWLHRLGSQEFMFPVWHDSARLTADVAAGSAVIPFDNTNREFTVGGMAVLIGATPHDFDAVTIIAMDANGITVTGAEVVHAWPAGSTIHPMRRSRLEAESVFAAITSRVGEATLRFDLNQANDIADEGEWDLEFAGLPVLTDKPDRKENLDLSFFRKLFTLDNEHGLRYLADDADRAFTVQRHSWIMRGRQEHADFRAKLYRLRGRHQAVWLPSFNEDMVLARPALAADQVLDIRKIGYAYTGGAVSGRKFILIGDTIAEITGTGAPQAAGEERLVLSAPLGADFPAGRSASFLDVCRLDQDGIEIEHHTDSDGVAEAQAAFRSFLNERTAPEPLQLPIPDAGEEAGLCGVPDSETCLNMAVFEDWFLKIRYQLNRTDASIGGSNIGASPDFGMGAVGHFLSSGSRPVARSVFIEEGNDVEEYTFYVEPPEGVDWQYQKQHGSGTVPSGTRARHRFRRWDDADWTTVAPTSGYGIDAQTAVDGSFKVQSLWPTTRNLHF